MTATYEPLKIAVKTSGGGGAERDESGPGFLWIVALAALHVPLGLLLHRYALLGTAHSALTFVIGIAWILRGRADSARPAYVAAYIASSEILWRTSRGAILYEFGKYSIALILLLAIIRERRKLTLVPLCYFGLLLPSALLTISELDSHTAMNALSFNLSGPFALALSVLYFRGKSLTPAQLRGILASFFAPVSGLAAIVAVSASSIRAFNTDSNGAAAGGFGANQVSAILGLAALASFLYVVHARSGRRLQIFLLGQTVVFIAAALITFSRGGLYMFGAGAALSFIWFLGESRVRKIAIWTVPLIVIVTLHWVVPKLNNFTHGALEQRFSSLDPTNRQLIAGADLRLWRENPVLGVGPGMGFFMRHVVHETYAAHTEYTRLLAEHGTLGLLALLILLGLPIRQFTAARNPLQRAFVSAMFAYSLLFMLVDAMRLAAPSITYGLGCATIIAAKPARRYRISVRWREAA